MAKDMKARVYFVSNCTSYSITTAVWSDDNENDLFSGLLPKRDSTLLHPIEHGWNTQAGLVWHGPPSYPITNISIIPLFSEFIE